MIKVPGLSLLEALVVLAIVAVATTAAFGVLRRQPTDLTPSLQEQLASRVSFERAKAIRRGAPITLSSQALLPNAAICGASDIAFYPDGTVSADPICILINGEEQVFQITPIYGALTEGAS